MLRVLIIILACTLFVATATAQQSLRGRVLENKTHITLRGIRVYNPANKQSVITDSTGKFSIAAKVDELLIFSGFAYNTDTILVVSLSSLEVFLEPKGQLLKEVKVSQSQLKIPGIGPGGTPEFHNQPVVYQRDAAGNYKGGVAFRFFNNSGEKKRQADAEKERTEAKRSEIDKVFSVKNLSQYVPIKGNELEGFRMYYIPSVAVYTSPRFNLLSYIDSCYKEFQALPADRRILQPLGKPME